MLFTKGVIRSLGQLELLDFQVKQQSIKETEIIVLVTDCMTKDYRSIPKLDCILGKEDWVKDLDEFTGNCAQNNNDDATLVVCRRR